MNIEEVIEFRAVNEKECIAGYMYLEDADDEAPLHFYDAQGLEIGNYLPYSESELYQAFCEDDIRQILCDFAEKNVTIERDGYSLVINEGAMMEAEVVKYDRNPDYGENMNNDILKFNCEKAVEFIEACFDENNKDDEMSFDERIQERISNMPAPVQDIVAYALEEDETRVFELEELEEDPEDQDLISYLDEDLEEIF